MLLAGLSLCGCGAMMEPDWNAYSIDVSDVRALKVDAIQCKNYALSYKSDLSISRIATAGIRGAGNNVAEAPISPIIPLAGAAGGAGAEALSGMNIVTDKRRRIYLRCLYEKGQRSGKYAIVDPDL